MLKPSLCDYTDAHILAKGTVTIPNTGTAANPNHNNNKVIFKNCVPFTVYITELHNAQVDNTKSIDVVIPMYNLKEYK